MSRLITCVISLSSIIDFLSLLFPTAEVACQSCYCRDITHSTMGSYSYPDPLPYWQVNVPPEDREEKCPEFLRDVSNKDVGIIGTPNEEYRVQTWQEVVGFIHTDRLADFRRWPSDLRRYREYIWELKRAYGSVMNFMLKERLCWHEPVVPRGSRPFECHEDFKILMNDWPYGLDKRIVHLVVWTKFDLPDDRETEAEIEAFVDRVFSPGVSQDKVSDTPPMQRKRLS